jgi:hypothetical protein
MDNFLHRHVRDTQQLSGFFTRILHWLAGLVQLTEEEQGEAGIYLGDSYSSEWQSGQLQSTSDKEKT